MNSASKQSGRTDIGLNHTKTIVIRENTSFDLRSSKDLSNKFVKRSGLDQSPGTYRSFVNNTPNLLKRSKKCIMNEACSPYNNQNSKFQGGFSIKSSTNKKLASKIYSSSKNQSDMVSHSISYSNSLATLKTLKREDQIQKHKINAANSVELSQAELECIEDIEMCPIHPEKRIEGYCKSDDALLCVTCILEENHRHHDVVTISRAFKEQKLFVRSKLAKIFKTQESMNEK